MRKLFLQVSQEKWEKISKYLVQNFFSYKREFYFKVCLEGKIKSNVQDKKSEFRPEKGETVEKNIKEVKFSREIVGRENL